MAIASFMEWGVQKLELAFRVLNSCAILLNKKYSLLIVYFLFFLLFLFGNLFANDELLGFLDDAGRDSDANQYLFFFILFRYFILSLMQFQQLDFLSPILSPFSVFLVSFFN